MECVKHLVVFVELLAFLSAFSSSPRSTQLSVRLAKVLSLPFGFSQRMKVFVPCVLQKEFAFRTRALNGAKATAMTTLALLTRGCQIHSTKNGLEK